MMQMPKARTAMALINEITCLYPEREALVGAEQRYNWHQVNTQIRIIARGLYGAGMRSGDKVAILMGNRPEWIIADFAIMALGGVMVAANTWATPRELAYQLSHSESKILIMSASFKNRNFLKLYDELTKEDYDLSNLEKVYCISDDILPDDICNFRELEQLSTNVSDTQINRIFNSVKPTDIACLLYTSGSTALPKGVLLQHFALIENMWNIGERLHINKHDRLWLAVSLFWGLGCENALFALWSHGACIVLQEYFDAKEAIELISNERCTVYYGTPNMLNALQQVPVSVEHDLSAFKTGATLGSPAQINQLISFGVTRACQIYGLTETYGNCSINDAYDTLERRTESIGKPLPGNDMIVVNPETGNQCATGEIGEIRLAGYVTPGYYKDLQKTTEAIDNNGYFCTGDLGYIDIFGYFYFRGRAKEMIKTGGINVSPAEIEDLLNAHEFVELSYVVGVPDHQRDEIVAAVVITSQPITKDSLLEVCKKNLAAYKVPRAIKFISHKDLPLTNTGKLNKKLIKNLFI